MNPPAGNRPSSLVRWAGVPRNAIMLFVLYAVIVLRWLDAGDVPWWLVLCALAAAVRTRAAIGEVRRYEAWRVQWQAMGEPLGGASLNAPSRRQKKFKRGWVFVVVGALLLVAIPWYLPQVPEAYEGQIMVLEILWGASALYLGFLITRGILRRKKKSGSGKVEAAPVVAWLLGRASSSPSRADAMRQLPEYSARLIGAVASPSLARASDSRGV